jgi:hypothetical protein
MWTKVECRRLRPVHYGRVAPSCSCKMFRPGRLMSGADVHVTTTTVLSRVSDTYCSLAKCLVTVRNCRDGWLD